MNTINDAACVAIQYNTMYNFSFTMAPKHITHPRKQFIYSQGLATLYIIGYVFSMGAYQILSFYDELNIIHFTMVVLSLMFAVSGVSAEWVNDSFASLRVSLPGGSTHRITYTSVNKSNTTEPKTLTTDSISHVVEDLRPNWFYTILVEVVSVDSDEAVNGSIGIGEQFHVVLFTCMEVLL